MYSLQVWVLVHQCLCSRTGRSRRIRIRGTAEGVFCLLLWALSSTGRAVRPRKQNLLPCRLGFSSLKEGRMKVPYTRLSQSTSHKVVTIKFIESPNKTYGTALDPKQQTSFVQVRVRCLGFIIIIIILKSTFLSSPPRYRNQASDPSTERQHW